MHAEFRTARERRRTDSTIGGGGAELLKLSLVDRSVWGNELGAVSLGYRAVGRQSSRGSRLALADSCRVRIINTLEWDLSCAVVGRIFFSSGRDARVWLLLLLLILSVPPVLYATYCRLLN